VLAACDHLGDDTRFCLNDPVLSAFEIIPNTLHVSAKPDTVTFNVDASRVIGVGVTVESPAGLREGCYTDTLRVGLWHCRVVVPQASEAGTWWVAQLLLDETGLGEFCTVSVVTGAQLQNAGYPTGIVVVN
jgi:hypothetical protein